MHSGGRNGARRRNSRRSNSRSSRRGWRTQHWVSKCNVHMKLRNTYERPLTEGKSDKIPQTDGKANTPTDSSSGSSSGSSHGGGDKSDESSNESVAADVPGDSVAADSSKSRELSGSSSEDDFDPDKSLTNPEMDHMQEVCKHNVLFSALSLTLTIHRYATRGTTPWCSSTSCRS